MTQNIAYGIENALTTSSAYDLVAYITPDASDNPTSTTLYIQGGSSNSNITELKITDVTTGTVLFDQSNPIPLNANMYSVTPANYNPAGHQIKFEAISTIADADTQVNLYCIIVYTLTVTAHGAIAISGIYEGANVTIGDSFALAGSALTAGLSSISAMKITDTTTGTVLYDNTSPGTSATSFNQSIASTEDIMDHDIEFQIIGAVGLLLNVGQSSPYVNVTTQEAETISLSGEITLNAPTIPT
jgi:hypothetical protein